MSSVRCRTYDRFGWHDNASTPFAGEAVRILETRLLRCLRSGSRSPLIRGAERSIAFESYVYRSGAIGRDFADALSERARAAVKGPLLLDWLGSSKLDAARLAAMEAPGGQCPALSGGGLVSTRSNEQPYPPEGARRRRQGRLRGRSGHRRRLGRPCPGSRP